MPITWCSISIGVIWRTWVCPNFEIIEPPNLFMYICILIVIMQVSIHNYKAILKKYLSPFSTLSFFIEIAPLSITWICLHSNYRIQITLCIEQIVTTSYQIHKIKIYFKSNLFSQNLLYKTKITVQAYQSIYNNVLT